jgi:hypothetical protein
MRWIASHETAPVSFEPCCHASPPAPAGSPRDRILAPLLERLGEPCPPGAAAMLAGEPLPHVVPNAPLRARLLADPALAALLPALSGSILLDDRLDVPCRIEAGGSIRLSPMLVERPPLLVAVTRWAIELAAAAFLAERAGESARRAALVAALRHGAALLSGLREEERRALAQRLPDGLAAFLDGDAARLLEAARDLARLVPATRPEPFGDAADWQAAQARVAALDELAWPLEEILVAGGDARLAVDPKRGLNRYGTAPRPRPEAIHFSSSTASSISDYGFRLADALRRRLLARGLATDAAGLHADLADRVRGCIAELMELGLAEVDIALAASGTDTELQAVLLALAADPEAPLTNVLIAPEETGRGVVLAGAGRWFDDLAASGVPVAKGTPVWPRRVIDTRAVAVRGEDGSVRPAAAILDEVRAHVAAALAAGRRVLLHVVLGSKTGISAPPPDEVERLRALDPARIDVVVDACQLRVTPSLLGGLVRRGWMVQVTGSKFLTGPAFSGALLVPAAMRGRVPAMAGLLAVAPALAGPADWPASWHPAPSTCPPGSYGPLFRWVVALGEA